MYSEEFTRFIDEQDEKLKTYGKSNGTELERIYARTIKLGEEFGELCDEVLAHAGDQRKNKLADEHDLEGEFADVIIVTHLLAKSMHIDIDKALAKKMVKIRDRHNAQLSENGRQSQLT
jgi:NTP pyrophosphatase (non-canonical NTP hydrolase)